MNRALGAFLLIAALLIGTSLIPSCQKDNQPIEKTDQAKSTKSDQDKCATFGTLFIRKIGDVAQTHEKEITALSTFAIAIFTVVLAVASGLQYCAIMASIREARRATDNQRADMLRSIKAAEKTATAATQSAKVAEDTLFVGQRPYIFITKSEFDEPVEIGMFSRHLKEGGEPSGPVIREIFYFLENLGKTPAEIIEFCSESICAAKLPDVPEYRAHSIYPSRYVLGQGAPARMEFAFKIPIDEKILRDVATPEHLRVGNPRKLFAYGYVKYRDIFGYENTLGFCWRYHLRLQVFIHEDHEAYNYRKSEKPSLRS